MCFGSYKGGKKIITGGCTDTIKTAAEKELQSGFIQKMHKNTNYAHNNSDDTVFGIMIFWRTKLWLERKNSPENELLLRLRRQTINDHFYLYMFYVLYGICRTPVNPNHYAHTVAREPKSSVSWSWNAGLTIGSLVFEIRCCHRAGWDPITHSSSHQPSDSKVDDCK